MNPEYFMLPIERGRDSETCLVMVNGFLFLSLATIYITKKMMSLAEKKFFAFL